LSAVCAGGASRCALHSAHRAGCQTELRPLLDLIGGRVVNNTQFARRASPTPLALSSGVLAFWRFKSGRRSCGMRDAVSAAMLERERPTLPIAPATKIA